MTAPKFSDGDLVIVSHPAFNFVHLVGRVVGPPTKSMFNVSYFNDRDGFNEKPMLRKHNAVACVLPIGTDYHAVAASLKFAVDAHKKAISAADEAYMAVVRKGGDL